MKYLLYLAPLIISLITPSSPVMATSRIIPFPDIKITQFDHPDDVMTLVKVHPAVTGIGSRCSDDIALKNFSRETKTVETSGYTIKLSPQNQIRWSLCYKQRDYHYSNGQTLHLLPLPITPTSPETPWKITGTIDQDNFSIEGIYIDEEIETTRERITRTMIPLGTIAGLILTIVGLFYIGVKKIRR